MPARWSEVVRLVLIVTAAAASAGCVRSGSSGAPPQPGSPIDPAAECRTIEQILAPAHPEPGAARVLKRLHACPERAGASIAGALDTLRTSSDTAAIAWVADLVRYVHDDRLYRMSLDIALDRSASAEARVFAFRSLVWSKAPGHSLRYSSMQMDPREAKCGAGSLGLCTSSATSHFYRGYVRGDLRWPALGRALPTDYLRRIQEVCEGVVMDESEPVSVRQAARHACWWEQDPELSEIIRGRSAPSAAQAT